MNDKIAIIGAGNIGTSIAKGLVASNKYSPKQIILTRRKTKPLETFGKQGFVIEKDNSSAVKMAQIVILTVKPQQIAKVLSGIESSLKPSYHILISTVTGVTLSQLSSMVKTNIEFIRVIPNSAIAVNNSVSCMSSIVSSTQSYRIAKEMFEVLGTTICIEEEKLNAATALGACGIAFFLRAIRAAMHGGIEIGLDSEESLMIAAQTALGAATLITDYNNHPEIEIDRVTTPRGCTIVGLNKMERRGFSSAMIDGIIASAEKASKLYLEN